MANPFRVRAIEVTMIKARALAAASFVFFLSASCVHVALGPSKAARVTATAAADSGSKGDILLIYLIAVVIVGILFLKISIDEVTGPSR
jgi:hypothetical protein